MTVIPASDPMWIVLLIAMLAFCPGIFIYLLVSAWWSRFTCWYRYDRKKQRRP